MDPLVHSPLRKGAIEVNHGAQPRCRHASRLRDYMAFRDAAIKKALGESLSEAVQTASRGHGRGEGHDSGVTCCEGNE